MTGFALFMSNPPLYSLTRHIDLYHPLCSYMGLEGEKNEPLRRTYG